MNFLIRRDELLSRQSLPPARNWPDWPEVVAGLDVAGDGSWLGLNDHGLVAAVLHREGTIGPRAGKRSRGELVLEALDHAEASEAAGALAVLHPDAYRPFNYVIADPRGACWLRHGGDGEIRVHPVPSGLHMLTAGKLDDTAQARINRFMPQFRAVAEPEPATGGWAGWVALLQRRDSRQGQSPAAVFGTVASSPIAVPACQGFHQQPVFLHAAGAPDEVAFVPVDLDRGAPATT